MGSWAIGQISAALPFKQVESECEPIFEVERDSDSLTVTSNCHAGAVLYEEGEMFERARHTIPIEEFQKLRRTVDVTFDIRIVLDDEGYVSSATIRATEDAMSEYGTVFETIAKRICSELRADRPSHSGCARRFEGIHLTIGRK